MWFLQASENHLNEEQLLFSPLGPLNNLMLRILFPLVVDFSIAIIINSKLSMSVVLWVIATVSRNWVVSGYSARRDQPNWTSLSGHTVLTAAHTAWRFRETQQDTSSLYSCVILSKLLSSFVPHLPDLLRVDNSHA